jgi:hypothetical protein
MDADTDDITSDGLGNCLTRDGQGIATAVLPMGGFRHTGVGNGVARTDYAALGQLQDNMIGFAIASGTGTYTATLSPAITSYVDGAQYNIRFTSSNTTAAPSLNLNGLGAITITAETGVALAIGAIQAGAETIVRYVAALTQFVIIAGDSVSPVLIAAGTSGTNVTSLSFTGLITSAFTDFKLKLRHFAVGGTSTGNFLLQLSTNNGSSYLSSGYSNAIIANPGSALSISTSGIPFYSLASPTDQHMNADISIINPANLCFISVHSWWNNSGAINAAIVDGFNSSGSAVNAISIPSGAGLFTTNYELWAYP